MRARGRAPTLAFPETERRRNIVMPLEDVGLSASPQRNCPRPPDSMGRLNLCIVNYSAGPCCSLSVRIRCKRETGVQVLGLTGLRGCLCWRKSRKSRYLWKPPEPGFHDRRAIFVRFVSDEWRARPSNAKVQKQRSDRGRTMVVKRVALENAGLLIIVASTTVKDLFSKVDVALLPLVFLFTFHVHLRLSFVLPPPAPRRLRRSPASSSATGPISPPNRSCST